MLPSGSDDEEIAIGVGAGLGVAVNRERGELTMPDTALASWNDGPAKQAIVDFVTSATTPGAGFVPVADRIATFDNDGTLWVEQPLAAAVRFRVSQVGRGDQGGPVAG